MILLYFFIFFFSDYVNSYPMDQNKHYIKLRHTINNQPKILEFFSFYCLHCYQFDQKITKKLNKEKFKIVKYHVSSLGPMGKIFTHAWALSVALGIENEFSNILFQKIHEKNVKIKDEKDIKEIFKYLGIREEEYYYFWNSIYVKILIIRQDTAVLQFPFHSIPVVFVKGKYMIKNESLDISSINSYKKHFLELLKFLINKE